MQSINQWILQKSCNKARTMNGARKRQTNKLVLGAGDGGRTRDVQLGKLAFYH